jgi:hypothetical protein
MGNIVVYVHVVCYQNPVPYFDPFCGPNSRVFSYIRIVSNIDLTTVFKQHQVSVNSGLFANGNFTWSVLGIFNRRNVVYKNYNLPYLPALLAERS